LKADKCKNIMHKQKYVERTYILNCRGMSMIEEINIPFRSDSMKVGL